MRHQPVAAVLLGTSAVEIDLKCDQGDEYSRIENRCTFISPAAEVRCL
jgi:hypothetical protein